MWQLRLVFFIWYKLVNSTFYVAGSFMCQGSSGVDTDFNPQKILGRFWSLRTFSCKKTEANFGWISPVSCPSKSSSTVVIASVTSEALLRRLVKIGRSVVKDGRNPKGQPPQMVLKPCKWWDTCLINWLMVFPLTVTVSRKVRLLFMYLDTMICAPVCGYTVSIYAKLLRTCFWARVIFHFMARVCVLASKQMAHPYMCWGLNSHGFPYHRAI